MKKIFLICLCFIFLFKASAFATPMAQIMERGSIICGGFQSGYENGDDIDFINCKIMAVALFDDENAMKIKLFKNELRFNAMFNGDVDIIHASKTLKREFNKNYLISNPHIYDNLVFISLSSNSEISSPLDVEDDSGVCILNDGLSEKQLTETMLRFMPEKDFQIKAFDNLHQIKLSLLSQECKIAYIRYTLFFNFLEDWFFPPPLKVIHKLSSPVPAALITLPESKELITISDIVFNSMLRAEELGITKENVDDIIAKTNNEELLFMFGEIEGIGNGLSIDDKFVYRVIKKYGNYDQFFHKIYGKYSFYKIKRKLNHLVQNGGVFSPVRILPLKNEIKDEKKIKETPVLNGN